MSKIFTKAGMLLGILCISATGVTLAQGGSQTTELRGMECTVQKSVGEIPIISEETSYTLENGTVVQNTLSGDVVVDPDSEGYRLFGHLERKGYTSIDTLHSVELAGRTRTVALGNRSESKAMRLGAREHKNYLGIVDLQTESGNMKIYYKAGTNVVNMIVCNNTAKYSTAKKYTSTNKQIVVEEGEKSAEELMNAEELIFDSTDVAIPPIYTGEILLEITLPSLDKTITEYRQFKAGTLYDLVKERGYDRNTDRLELAEQAGLDMETYRGTKTQNLQIKAYMLDQLKLSATSSVVATTTPKISVPEKKYPTVKKAQLRKMVTLRGYVRKTDRLKIAKEFGFDLMGYFGTKAQNLKIRERLLSKISPRAE